jgi:hypothetical protein
MMKHSPGPWKWERSKGDPEVGMVYDADGNEVTVGHCGCCFPGDEHCTKADGMLIAAAPEMLELLRGVEWLGNRRAGPACPWCAGSHPLAGRLVMSGHGPDCQLAALLARVDGL